MESLARVAHALSEPIRLRILTLLVQGRTEACCSPADDCCPEGICVCDLEEALGMAQSKVSYHMRELREAGLVTEQRRGKWSYYSLNREALRRYLDEVEAAFLQPRPPLITLE